MDAKELRGIPKCVWAPWQNNGQLRQGHGGKVPPCEEPYGDKLQADAKDKAEKRAESAAERSRDILSGDQLADYRSQERTEDHAQRQEEESDDSAGLKLS